MHLVLPSSVVAWQVVVSVVVLLATEAEVVKRVDGVLVAVKNQLCVGDATGSIILPNFVVPLSLPQHNPLLPKTPHL